MIFGNGKTWCSFGTPLSGQGGVPVHPIGTLPFHFYAARLMCAIPIRPQGKHRRSAVVWAGRSSPRDRKVIVVDATSILLLDAVNFCVGVNCLLNSDCNCFTNTSAHLGRHFGHGSANNNSSGFNNCWERDARHLDPIAKTCRQAGPRGRSALRHRD